MSSLLLIPSTLAIALCGAAPLPGAAGNDGAPTGANTRDELHQSESSIGDSARAAADGQDSYDPWQGMDREEVRKASESFALLADELPTATVDAARDLADRVHAFFNYGTGTEYEPGDPLVTRKHGRELVLGLLWDVLVAPHEPNAPKADALLDAPLSDEMEEPFRDLFRAVISEAPEKLDFMQRTRAYWIARRSADPSLIEPLETAREAPSISDNEREHIDYTIDVIRRSVGQ